MSVLLEIGNNDASFWQVGAYVNHLEFLMYIEFEGRLVSVQKKIGSTRSLFSISTVTKHLKHV